MDYGGLPALVELGTDEQKASYLANMMETACLKDVIGRNRIGLPYLLENVVDILSSTACSLVNTTKIKDAMLSHGYESASEDTIARYIGFLENAYLFEKAERYDIKGRRYIGALEKYYPVDHGIANARLDFRQIFDRPHIMENIIYNELLCRDYSVDVGVVEISARADGKVSKKQCEIDFIAARGSKKYYIQSALNVSDPAKMDTELRPLKNTKDFFKKIIISKTSMKPWTDNDGILHLGLYEFLLNEESLDL